ncbi:hypothetical protein N9X61_02575 [Sulfurimonas sp.]|nr:hypothetical protein [Sulfurimonas sp.]
MIKLLSLLLFVSVSLSAVSFWTLTGITKANIYIVNEVAYLNPETVTKTKEKMTQTLHKLGIKTEQQDSPTLMITFTDIENDDTHYVYTQLAFGEEVQTFRDDKSSAFALTFLVNDFIDVDADELNSETLESVDYVLAKFTEQFKEDKE